MIKPIFLVKSYTVKVCSLRPPLGAYVKNSRLQKDYVKVLPLLLYSIFTIAQTLLCSLYMFFRLGAHQGSIFQKVMSQYQLFKTFCVVAFGVL